MTRSRTASVPVAESKNTAVENRQKMGYNKMTFLVTIRSFPLTFMKNIQSVSNLTGNGIHLFTRSQKIVYTAALVIAIASKC